MVYNVLPQTSTYLKRHMDILCKWFQKFIWIFNLQKNKNKSHISYEVSYAKLDKLHIKSSPTQCNAINASDWDKEISGAIQHKNNIHIKDCLGQSVLPTPLPITQDAFFPDNFT